MKNCLICQTGQDQDSLTRIPVKLEGAPWGDFLVCANCLEALGPDQVKALIQVAVAERSFEPSHVLRAGEGEAEGAQAGSLDLPISAALLRDPVAFARFVGEKIGSRLWEMHRHGVSGASLATTLTPDGEGGYVFSAAYSPTSTASPAASQSSPA